MISYKYLILENDMSENKAQSVIEFYLLCNKLKKLIRTGWLDWNVKAERLESVAEHIYGVQMLALAMNSQYDYDVDINKVIKMLAVHELEEICIGDLTLFQISREEKEILGHQAINKVLKGLIDKDEIRNLIMEFDERKTNEAKFAYQCDKLECDMQSKVYDTEGEIPLDADSQINNSAYLNKSVQELLAQGKSFSDMWLEFGRNRYPYDDNFREVSLTIENMDLHTQLDDDTLSKE